MPISDTDKIVAATLTAGILRPEDRACDAVITYYGMLKELELQDMTGQIDGQQLKALARRDIP